jgi:hypothetical protein
MNKIVAGSMLAVRVDMRGNALACLWPSFDEYPSKQLQEFLLLPIVRSNYLIRRTSLNYVCMYFVKDCWALWTKLDTLWTQINLICIYMSFHIFEMSLYHVPYIYWCMNLPFPFIPPYNMPLKTS